MIKTIISHDKEKGVARIRFEHAGVTVEDNFILMDVVPGTKFVFQQMGLAFDEAYQDLAIERLTSSIESQIDDGTIQNAPEPEAYVYEAPTTTTEPESDPAVSEPEEDVA